MKELAKKLTLTITPGEDYSRDAVDERIFGPQTREAMKPMFEKVYHTVQEIKEDLHNLGISPSIYLSPRRTFSLESIERGEWPNNNWPIVYTTHEDNEVAVIHIQNGHEKVSP